MGKTRQTTPEAILVPSLNLNVRGLGASATLAINERSAALRAQGVDIIRFGLGQSPFPVPEGVVEALRANAHQKDYLEVRGLRELREAVASYHLRRHRVARRAEDVLIGPGSKELMFLIQLVYYGDLVIPCPSWVSYAPQATMVGRQIRWLRTKAHNSYRLEPEELETLCAEDPERPRLLILNYPNNPTGATYTSQKLEALSDIARQYRVVVLSDEIYGEIHHKGRHRSIAEYYPEGTIISSGLSKWCGAGGWRLGTFTFPSNLSWLKDAMAVAASETYTATAAPIQYAAVHAFNGSSEIDAYLRQSRRVLHSLAEHCAAELTASGLDVVTPEGGFYLFPDFRPVRKALRARGIRTSQELAERLLDDTAVATLPSSSFGCAPDELQLRVAIVDFNGADALARAAALDPSVQAVEAGQPGQPVQAARPTDAGPLDGGFLQECCPRVLTGLKRITDWVAALSEPIDGPTSVRKAS